MNILDINDLTAEELAALADSPLAEELTKSGDRTPQIMRFNARIPN